MKRSEDNYPRFDAEGIPIEKLQAYPLRKDSAAMHASKDSQPVTTDDLKGLEESLTRADLLRLLRASLEVLVSSVGVYETEQHLLQTLMKVLLEDSLVHRNARDELLQEIGNCTPKELAVMRKALENARSPKEGDKSEPR